MHRVLTLGDDRCHKLTQTRVMLDHHSAPEHSNLCTQVMLTLRLQRMKLGRRASNRLQPLPESHIDNNTSTYHEDRPASPPAEPTHSAEEQQVTTASTGCMSAEDNGAGRLVSAGSDLPGTATAIDMQDAGMQTKIIMAGNPKRPPEIGVNRMSAAGVNNPQMDYGQVKFFDYNFHAVKKGVTSALLDVSLLMANASQLKSVIVAGSESQFYHVMLVLIIVSLSLQVIVGCVLIWLSRININDADDKAQDQATLLNNIVVIGVFLLTIVNVFIASIGISNPQA